MKSDYRRQGFTIVELMIALALGLLITAAMIFLFSSSKQSFNTQEGMSQVQESGRSALRVISRTLRYAGYLANPLLDTDPAVRFASPSDLAVTGTNNAVPRTAIGITSARSASDTPPTDTLEINYYGSADQNVQTCLGDNANDDTVSKAPTLVKNVFYLSAPDSRGLSTLNCLTMRIRDAGNTAFNNADGVAIPTTSGCPAPGSSNALCATTSGQPIVDGVSDFQILYGVDSDADGVANQYLDADNVTTPAQWRSVVAVQITLVIQSTNRVDGLNATTGGRVSRTYTSTVAIRNRLQR